MNEYAVCHVHAVHMLAGIKHVSISNVFCYLPHGSCVCTHEAAVDTIHDTANGIQEQIWHF